MSKFKGTMSISRLPLSPIFNRLNLSERHRNKGSGAQVNLTSHTIEPALPSLAKPLKPVVPHGSTQCWIGQCEGCGKTLISATWDPILRSTKNVYCTQACRAAHDAATG